MRRTQVRIKYCLMYQQFKNAGLYKPFLCNAPSPFVSSRTQKVGLKFSYGITKIFSISNFPPYLCLMPYYRILIWTKRRRQPYTGIRLIGDANINAVYQSMHGQAFQKYRHDLVDVEVQMLSKLCSAVKQFEANGLPMTRLKKTNV